MEREGWGVGRTAKNYVNTHFKFDFNVYAVSYSRNIYYVNIIDHSYSGRGTEKQQQLILFLRATCTSPTEVTLYQLPW